MYIFKRHLKGFQLSADLGYSVNSKYFSVNICVYRSSNTHAVLQKQIRETQKQNNGVFHYPSGAGGEERSAHGQTSLTHR